MPGNQTVFEFTTTQKQRLRELGGDELVNSTFPSQEERKAVQRDRTEAREKKQGRPIDATRFDQKADSQAT